MCLGGKKKKDFVSTFLFATWPPLSGRAGFAFVAALKTQARVDCCKHTHANRKRQKVSDAGVCHFHIQPVWWEQGESALLWLRLETTYCHCYAKCSKLFFSSVFSLPLLSWWQGEDCGWFTHEEESALTIPWQASCNRFRAERTQTKGWSILPPPQIYLVWDSPDNCLSVVWIYPVHYPVSHIYAALITHIRIYDKTHTYQVPPSCCGSLVFVNVTHVSCRLSENQSLSQVTLKHLSLLTHNRANSLTLTQSSISW